MPLRHEGIKFHKVLNNNNLHFRISSCLCGKKDFLEWTQCLFSSGNDHTYALLR